MRISFAFESETGKIPFSRTFWHLFNKCSTKTKIGDFDKKRLVTCISDWLFFVNYLIFNNKRQVLVIAKGIFPRYDIQEC